MPDPAEVVHGLRRVTRTTVALVIGITTTTVTKRVQDRIYKLNEDGTFDLAQCVRAEIELRTREKPAKVTDLETARLRRAQAISKELENEEQMRNLIGMDAAEDMNGKLIGIFLSGLHQLKGEMVAVGQQTSDPGELHDACQRIIDGIQSGLHETAASEALRLRGESADASESG